MPVYFFSSEFCHKKHQKLLKKIIPTIGFVFLLIILLVKKKFQEVFTLFLFTSFTSLSLKDYFTFVKEQFQF